MQQNYSTMPYIQTYYTPPQFDDLIIESDGELLTGLHFANDNYIPKSQKNIENNLPIFDETRRWLDKYFSGKQPNFLPKFRIVNATNFRQKVLEILLKIPYGDTTTYGQIAAQISPKMSAQAVGGAVGRNPICIIIPCHRVIGVSGKMVGYGGGMKNKIALLNLEKKW